MSVVAGRPFAPSRHGWARFGIGAAFGVITGVLLSLAHALPVAVVAAWDVGAAVQVALLWWVIARSDPDETERRAGGDDPGRTLVYAVVLIASSISLLAATVLARQSKTLAPGESRELAILCLGAVALAWALTHSTFTLRYAHLYYREDDGVGGIDFVGKTKPSDFDFAYFAFTIGMCFQVSDVVVSNSKIRRAVLGHALLSFVYNTAVLALALNLGFGLVG